MTIAHTLGEAWSSLLMRMGTLRPRLEPSGARRRSPVLDGEAGPRSAVHAGHAAASAEHGVVVDASGMELARPSVRREWARGRAQQRRTRAAHAARAGEVALFEYGEISAGLAAHGLGHLVGAQEGGRWTTLGPSAARTCEIFGGGLLAATALGLDVSGSALEAVEALGIGSLIGLGTAAAGEHLATVLRRFEAGRFARRHKPQLLASFPDLAAGPATVVAGLFGLLLVTALLVGVTMARFSYQDLLATASGLPLDPVLGLAGGLMTIGGMIATFALRYAQYDPLTSRLLTARANNLHASRSYARHEGMARRYLSLADGQARVSDLILWRLSHRFAAVVADSASETFRDAGEGGVDDAVAAFDGQVDIAALRVDAPTTARADRPEAAVPFPAFGPAARKAPGQWPELDVAALHDVLRPATFNGVGVGTAGNGAGNAHPEGRQ